MSYLRSCYLTLVLSAYIPASALACPTIDGLVDFNCDGILKIAVTGDSIVRGIGDKEGTPQNAGWVFDLSKHFPNAIISNQGVSGTTSQRLRGQFLRNLKPGISTYRSMRNADYVIIQVGTNEYWNRKPVSVTVQGIRRLRDSLKKFYENDGRGVPHFVVATVPQSKRSFQNPFLLELATALLASKRSLNVQIRFHDLGKEIISDDQLHPSKKGYDRMAVYAVRKLQRKIQPQVINLRPDDDSDGIYDFFELEKFGTDPTLFDTDGDGFGDGEEVFVIESDPLDPLDPAVV